MSKLSSFISGVAILAPALVLAQLSPVGSEFQVNTFTAENQYFPSVCSDANGNFVVAWQSYSLTQAQDGDIKGIFAQRFDSNGQPQGTEFQVNTYTVDMQGYPAIACGAAGNFVIVWGSLGQDGDNYGVFGQRYSSSGDPAGTEFQVNTFTAGQQDYATVASAANGDFVVVWASDQQDGGGFGIFGRRYASSGAPLDSEFQINTYSIGKQSGPALADTPDGRFVVVWTSYGQDGDQGGLFGQRYSSTGDAAGTEFQVNSFAAGTQYQPDVAADQAGNFVVVWASYRQDGYDYGIIGQRFDSAGGRLGTEFVVNTYTTGTEYFPAVAVDPAGNFVVVWTTYDYIGRDGDSTGVFGRQFQSAGVAVGSEFQVNTYTYAYQSYPTISAQGVGAFVVAWQSYDQDGFGFGVIGQRFTSTQRLLGDCNDDGRVTTNELIVGVYIDLGTLPLSVCEAMDGNRDGVVMIDDLVGAIANALAG